ncbi:hypothetical protein TNCV_5057021 [Trichonephila clavipes]|nr:hypothetical protein TNCV_5057021 [Trichonephila clavipes]
MNRAAFSLRHTSAYGAKRRERRDKKIKKLKWSYPTPTSQQRSISAFKTVKTEKYAMENEKLYSLILMCTQNDITMEIDFNIINDFAMIKGSKTVQ